MSVLSRSSLAAFVMIGAAAALTTVSTPSQAETGGIRVNVVTGGVGVGGGTGNGMLRFRRKQYPFSVSGNGIGIVGISKKEFVGRAYNMTKPDDIVGSYNLVGTGAAVVKGARVLRLKNSNGVVMELRGVATGVEVQAGVTTINVTMP